MKKVLFTDIDDCFMSTVKKFREDEILITAATDAEGKARSFISEKQLALLEIFVNGGVELVPVTGRSYSTLMRVTLDSLLKSWKIVSHGAMIVKPNGDYCEQWLEYLHSNFLLEDWSEKLSYFNQVLSSSIRDLGLSARSYVVSEQGVDCYICIKCVEGTNYSNAFDAILRHSDLDLDEIKIHRNGRNLALLPPYTRKQLAVEFLKEQFGVEKEYLALSMGDSLSDIPFMKQADFSFIPTKSQIAGTLTW